MLAALLSAPLASAQSSPAADPANEKAASTGPTLSYQPPTQEERFRTYLRHTYSLGSVLEAAARGGIQQARDRPSQWQEGAQADGERVASSMGMIAVRGTTNYLLADLFREDLRYEPNRDSKVKAAFEDTFTCRRGSDGHRALSVARLIGPIAGSVIATSTWYPRGYGRREIVRETAITYGLVFVRNLVRDSFRH